MNNPNDPRYACDERFPGRQVLRLIRRALGRYRLDLGGLGVLTEAGVGYRRVTPVIAGLAGASVVYAVARDTAEASRREAEEQTAYLCALAGLGDRVRVIPNRLNAGLGEIDIVTDLPGVRPVDESVLRNASEAAAVTLMGGVAQWRAADVDAATCRRRGVAVAGVDEDAIDLYRFLPDQAAWGLLQLGVTLADAVVLLAGDGPASTKVARGLSQAGARVLAATPDGTGRVTLCGAEKVADSLAEAIATGCLTETDALVLCPADPSVRTVGLRGWIEAAALAAAAPHLAVLSLSGEVDGRGLAGAGVRCWPGPGDPAPLELLPAPLIELHVAGLKVGEAMARARRRGSSSLAAEQLAATEAHAELLPKDLATAVRR